MSYYAAAQHCVDYTLNYQRTTSVRMCIRACRQSLRMRDHFIGYVTWRELVAQIEV